MEGFLFPRTPLGRASLLPPPPWHYSGEMLTVEYRTDPEVVAEYLPAGLEPHPDDPGAVALIWADWQSCGPDFSELVEPERSQYKEVFLVVRTRWGDSDWSRCVFIWVDKDFAMVRGFHQGYPKKLGDIWMTRPVSLGRAGPKLEVGGSFGATLSASGHRLAQARLMLTDPADRPGFVNAHPMLHHRRWPTIESDGSDAIDELVTMRGFDGEVADVWEAEAELDLGESPFEELSRFAPTEIIGGYYHRVATSWREGTTLERRKPREG